jgi:hypothetical protein
MNDETLYTTIACASQPAFYPLTIHWDSNGRKWSVYFQSKPTYRVYRTGDMPTRDELVDALVHAHMPILFIHVMETIVATCEVALDCGEQARQALKGGSQ